MVRLLGPGFGY
jgi:hypothetical protein